MQRKGLPGKAAGGTMVRSPSGLADAAEGGVRPARGGAGGGLRGRLHAALVRRGLDGAWELVGVAMLGAFLIGAMAVVLRLPPRDPQTHVFSTGQLGQYDGRLNHPTYVSVMGQARAQSAAAAAAAGWGGRRRCCGGATAATSRSLLASWGARHTLPRPKASAPHGVHTLRPLTHARTHTTPHRHPYHHGRARARRSLTSRARSSTTAPARPTGRWSASTAPSRWPPAT
jgi:fluoride ion exporter CrcB/FEX